MKGVLTPKAMITLVASPLLFAMLVVCSKNGIATTYTSTKVIARNKKILDVFIV